MNHRLDRITSNLLRHVPDPPKPIARPTASFAGLKVGQRIVLRTSIVGDPLCEVIATDSQGATVKQGDAINRLEDRQWKERWARVRNPRKRKEPRT